jgi:hypothetical protein
MPKNYTIMTITGCVLPIRTMRDRDESRRERERERERGEDVDDGKKRDFFLFNKKNSLWNKVKNIYIILMI